MILIIYNFESKVVSKLFSEQFALTVTFLGNHE
jgi:hypothetical protein